MDDGPEHFDKLRCMHFDRIVFVYSLQCSASESVIETISFCL